MVINPVVTHLLRLPKAPTGNSSGGASAYIQEGPKNVQSGKLAV